MTFETLSGRRGSAHARQRESAGAHFRKLDEAAPAAGDPARDREPCRFEIYRADEVRVTAMRLSGGDWYWRLCDTAGSSLVEAGGYRTERECRDAIHALKAEAALATLPGDA